VLDAVHLEERGVPTVTFVTAPFEAAARTHARLQGVDDLPFVIVPADYLASTPGLDAMVVDEVLDKLRR
jgi:hypothetical protein